MTTHAYATTRNYSTDAPAGALTVAQQTYRRPAPRFTLDGQPLKLDNINEGDHK